MPYMIPIKASSADTEELSRLLSGLKTDELDVSVQTTSSSGLSMEASTVSLLFELLKVSVPALITALSLIWVEHLKDRKKKEHPTDKPKPTVVIEMDTGNIRIDLDISDIKSAVRKEILPKDIQEITRIRLEE